MTKPAAPKWEPPHGYMLFYRRVVSIQEVEQHAKQVMRHHDRQPRTLRDRENCPEDYKNGDR